MRGKIKDMRKRPKTPPRLVAECSADLKRRVTNAAMLREMRDKEWIIEAVEVQLTRESSGEFSPFSGLPAADVDLVREFMRLLQITPGDDLFRNAIWANMQLLARELKQKE